LAQVKIRKQGSNGDSTATTPAKSDWSQISFSSGAGTSTIDNAIIKYGGYVTSGKYGVMSALLSALTLTDSTISTNNSYAVYSGTNTNLTKSGNSASDNSRNGVYVQTGTTSSNTRWQGDDLPYVFSSFTVGQNKLHMIDAGTVVKFESGGSLIVNGALNADGTSSQRIIATSVKDDTYGGDTNNDGTATVPAKSNWAYIIFNDQSIDASSVIDYANILYGGSTYGNVYLNSASPSITNSTIEKSGTAGIYLNSSSYPTLSGNTISDNKNAIYVNKVPGSLTISHNVLSDSTGTASSSGVYLLDASATVISDNTVTANGYGIYATGASSSTVTGNLISANNFGVYATDSSSVTVSSNTISSQVSNSIVMAKNSMVNLASNQTTGNAYNTILLTGSRTVNATLPKQDLPYSIDSFSVGANTTTTLAAGTIYKFQDSTSLLTVVGTLLAQGTSSNKIIFTSMKDDSHGGDTNNDGSASQPSAGDWYQISLNENAGNSILDHVDILYGGKGSGGYYGYGAVYIDNSSPEIKNSYFSDNQYSGIKVSSASASPTITDSTFINNGNGLSFTNGAGGTVKNNTISSSMSQGVYTLYSGPRITKNTFEKNSQYGIYNLGGAGQPMPTANYNDFFANGVVDVYNWAPYSLDTKYNYGGTLGGPIITSTNVVAVPYGGVPYTAKGKELEKVYAKRRAMWYGGDPVNASTGNFYSQHEDLALPGKGLPFNFTRTYNSQDTMNNGPLGRGWTHGYNASLRFDESSATTVFYPDGRRVTFNWAGGGNYTADSDIFDRLVKDSDTTYTLTLPDQTKYRFNANGRLVNQEDKYKNLTSLTYVDAQSQGTTVTLLHEVSAPGGRRLTFTYDANNRYMTQITDSASRTVSYSYDTTASTLIGFTDARGKTTTYSYDDEYQLTGIKEAGQNKEIWRNFYTDGRVTAQLDAFDTTLSFAYDPENQNTTMTDRRGNQTVVNYDSNYWVTRVTNALSAFAEYVYGVFDLPERIIDERGWTKYFTYDANGNTTSTVDQEGHETQASYDLANNNLLWSKDALGRQTTYSYDTTGTLVQSVTSPIGTTLFDYYNDGLLKTTTDALGHTTDFAYNTAGNLTKITDAINTSTTMDYDAAGRMTAVTDAEGNKSQFAYDGNSNILNILDPLALVFPSERHQVDFTYDDRGNQDSFKDANNNLTNFFYDGMNNLTNVVDANDATTTYGYDPNYNLSSVTDAESHTTLYGYDANDRLKSTTDALGYDTRYGYDPSGNLTETAYPNGNESYFEYFKDKLLKRVSYNNDSRTYDFTYNPTHTLKDVTDNSARVWAFGYDAGDRLAVTTDPISASLGDFVINRSYDGGSNLTGIKAGSESTVAYGYNDRYDLTDLDLPGTSGDISFGYDDARKRTNITMPGSVSDFGFDAASRVTTVTIDTSSTDSSFIYAHDANGNILSQNDTRYRYDALNRLTDWFNPDNDTTTTYGYDKVGNLLEVKENGVTTRTLSYNDANQIDSSGYGYDVNGNMATDTANVYKYDGDNRLTAVIGQSTETTIATYAYDFMGRRTSSTDASGTTTYFHYDGWNVVAESDASGAITARYYYDNISQIIAMKKSGNFYYYQFNAHGDVVSVTDGSGTVVNTYEHDPCGNPLATSETVANPYRYAGYRYDGNTGLYYLRARYYSPGDYRFLNKDPKRGDTRNPLTLNPYLYVNDNPVNLIDPTGKDIINTMLAIAGATVAIRGLLVYGGIIASSPGWVWVGIAIAAASLAYSSYQADTGQVSVFQTGVSGALTILGAIPVIGASYALADVGWEAAWTLDEYVNGPRIVRQGCRP